MARLSEDEQRVSLVELRGNSTVKGDGSLESMTARDMDLQYAEDGETLQRARADRGRPGGREAGATRRRPPVQRRRVGADARRGRARSSARRDATASSWTCSKGESGGQQVNAREFDAVNGPSGALSNLRFGENVEYREEGAGKAVRRAKGRTLQLRLADDAVRSAVFEGGASFEDGDLSAEAAEIQYDVERDSLVLDAKTPEGRSRLSDEQVSLTARHVEVGLKSESMWPAGR